jgi:hypothetical protein
VNCEYPAPANARRAAGIYVPIPIPKALHHVVPDRVLAEGSYPERRPGHNRSESAEITMSVQY